MNTFAYGFAGAGEPFIGYLADVTGQSNIVFVFTAIMCFLGALTIIFVKH